MQKGLIVHTLISNTKGEILILRRSKKNDVLADLWDIPGGTLEDGEDPAEGAIREAKEETGLDISNPRLFFQKSNIDTGKNKQFITLIFTTRTSQTSVALNPKEHDEYAWIQPSMISGYNAVHYMKDCVRSYEDLRTNPIN